MRRLRNRDEGPPEDGDGNSFRYTHPENGRVSGSRTWTDWRNKIYEHRQANNLPIPDNQMAIAEDQLCGLIPPAWCIYEPGDKPPVTLQKIGVSQVVSWVKAIMARFTAGVPMVEQAEAERRAAICVRCPYNVKLAGCGACSGLAKELTPGMKGKKTSEDSRLKNCAVCGCFGRVQVWFGLDILLEGATAEQMSAYPEEWCWKVRG